MFGAEQPRHSDLLSWDASIPLYIRINFVCMWYKWDINAYTETSIWTLWIRPGLTSSSFKNSQACKYDAPNPAIPAMTGGKKNRVTHARLLKDQTPFLAQVQVTTCIMYSYPGMPGGKKNARHKKKNERLDGFSHPGRCFQTLLVP